MKDKRYKYPQFNKSFKGVISTEMLESGLFIFTAKNV